MGVSIVFQNQGANSIALYPPTPGCLQGRGNENPAVVIPLLTQHYAMLQRNLVYTGITRGKQLVVLVGQKKALAMAVKNHLGRRRYTTLAEWMGDSRA